MQVLRFTFYTNVHIDHKYSAVEKKCGMISGMKTPEITISCPKEASRALKKNRERQVIPPEIRKKMQNYFRTEAENLQFILSNFGRTTESLHSTEQLSHQE